MSMNAIDERTSIPEDVYAVATALQGLVGAAYFGSRERFEQTARTLITRLPAPTALLESMWLREKLVNSNARATRIFHRAQGCHSSQCGMPPAEHWELEGIAFDRPSWRRVARSFAVFFAQFDRHHPRIGVPVRAARLLRRCWHAPQRMDRVAARLAISRSRMERLFFDRYGLTPHAYHARVRIRHALLLLHGSTAKVETVARRTGYASVGSFYRAFEASTPMSPARVRELDGDALDRLLGECFEVDIARLQARANWRAEPLMLGLSAFASVLPSF